MATLEEMHEKLMAMGLAYPQAYEENPWGERVVKVRGKIFMFSSFWKGKLYFTVKLPQSGADALTRDYAEPTGYGMGKSGWVSMSFEDASRVPLDEVPAWLDESYRTIAPKWLIKAMDEGPAAVAAIVAKKAAAEAEKAVVKAETGPKKPSRSAKSSAAVKSVALVGNDATRLQRARETFSEAGLKTVVEGQPTPETLSLIAKKKPGAVIIDLGRAAAHVLEFAHYVVDDLGGKIPLAFAGAHDAATEKKALALHDSVTLASRVPPGAPEFIAAFLARVTPDPRTP